MYEAKGFGVYDYNIYVLAYQIQGVTNSVCV